MSNSTFKAALNTSTIMPFNLDVKQQVKIAAQSGFTGIELWIKHIDAYVNEGGKLSELRKYIEDFGIEVVNGIAFSKWTDADPEVRAQGLEQAKREMETLLQLGCKAIAAPPFGNIQGVTLDDIAANFAKLHAIAKCTGIEPFLEIWGAAKILNRISHAMYILLESRVPNGKMIWDVYHCYKSGTSFEDLKLINGNSIGIVHINDYPSNPPRETITDRERTFPGDGMAPLKDILTSLKNIGYKGHLSLELFIQDFGSKDAVTVTKEGYDKVMKAIN